MVGFGSAGLLIGEDQQGGRRPWREDDQQNPLDSSPLQKGQSQLLPGHQQLSALLLAAIQRAGGPGISIWLYLSVALAGVQLMRCRRPDLGPIPRDACDAVVVRTCCSLRVPVAVRESGNPALDVDHVFTCLGRCRSCGL